MGGGGASGHSHVPVPVKMRWQRLFAGRGKHTAISYTSNKTSPPLNRMQMRFSSPQHMVVRSFLSQQLWTRFSHGTVLSRSSCSGATANIWPIVPT